MIKKCFNRAIGMRKDDRTPLSSRSFLPLGPRNVSESFGAVRWSVVGV